MESAKIKIDTAVAEYIRLFPDEYKAFADWSEKVRKEQTDEYARFSKDSSQAIERKLGEIPERLYTAITKLLTAEERGWFLAQGAFEQDFKGPYWFYKKYRVFAITVI